jgi:hypothetical protein
MINTLMEQQACIGLIVVEMVTIKTSVHDMHDLKQAK